MKIKQVYIVILILILIYLSYLIIKPFIAAILVSFVLAYLFFPLHKKIRRITKNEVFSAIIVTFLIVLIILLPLGFIANSLIKESIVLINSKELQNIEYITAGYISEDSQLKSSLASVSESILKFIKTEASSFLLTLPLKILSLVISTFVLFHSLLIGESLIKNFKQALPIKRKEELLNHIKLTINSIVYGLLATAILQFIMASIGFSILGVSSPFILALIIGLLGLIPFLGPIIIWAPLGILELIKTNYPKATGIIILGIILSLSETLIRIKIMSDKAKINPIIAILGVVGGIKLMGFIGVIVGPIILSTLFIILKEYYPLEKHEA